MSYKLFQNLFISKRIHCIRALISKGYKSAISIENLYPDSLNAKPFEPPSDKSKFNGYIPIDQLNISYTRSSGAGGQHVNKTNTKVDVRFHVQSANWLSQDVKMQLLTKLANSINKEGYFIIRSEKTRVQLFNQADAITRLRELIYKLEAPELEICPETEEKIRKKKERAARIRLTEKRNRSDVKAFRSL